MSPYTYQVSSSVGGQTLSVHILHTFCTHSVPICTYRRLHLNNFSSPDHLTLLMQGTLLSHVLLELVLERLPTLGLCTLSRIATAAQKSSASKAQHSICHTPPLLST
jgi:hypothetical protein